MAKKRSRPNRPKPRGGAAPTPKAEARTDTVEADIDRDAERTSKAARTSMRADKGEVLDDRDAARPSKRTDKAVLPEARIAGSTGRVDEPSFWFGFEVAWAKLVVTRVVLFGLLATDSVMLFRHAPRYGATDFNVGQLSMFDAIGPGRVAYGVGQLVLAYVFVMIAFGVATRVLVPIGAAIYGWLYLGSQLDSYQHHYLMLLVLVIASFVPWHRPANATPDTRVRSWALRLMLVQLAILYLWAAISKMHPAWLDGTTLGSQLTGGVRKVISSTIGFPIASTLVILTELGLAATIWWRRAWIVAAPLGIALHAGILLANLEIGLFAVLMLGIYVLVLPDGLFVWLADVPPFDTIGRLARRSARSSWLGIAIGVVTSLAIVQLVRFEDARVVAIGLVIVPVALAIRAVMRRGVPTLVVGIAHAAAIALWLVADRASSIAVDYYKFWGGSQRRLVNLDTAERAYRGLVEIAPDHAVGQYYLGHLLVTPHDPPYDAAVQARRDEEGLAALRRAQELDPAHARAFTEEARWLATHGKFEEAKAKAKEAVFAEPADGEARSLLDALSKPSPAMPREKVEKEDTEQDDVEKPEGP